MSLDYFSEILMPYCLSTKNGKWSVLNREYCPLGTIENSYFHKGEDDSLYLEIDIPSVFLDLLYKRTANDTMYWFYDDLTNPARSKQNRDRYLNLLRLFFNLSVFHEKNNHWHKEYGKRFKREKHPDEGKPMVWSRVR